jgi:hypothetical protein
MPSTFDPSWGIPVIGIVMCVAAYVWVRITVGAYHRKYGPDPE